MEKYSKGMESELILGETKPAPLGVCMPMFSLNAIPALLTRGPTRRLQLQVAGGVLKVSDLGPLAGHIVDGEGLSRHKHASQHGEPADFEGTSRGSITVGEMEGRGTTKL